MSGFAPHIPSYLHPDLTQWTLPCFTQGTDCRTCYAKTCLTTIQISVAPEYCCLGTETEHCSYFLFSREPSKNVLHIQIQGVYWFQLKTICGSLQWGHTKIRYSFQFSSGIHLLAHEFLEPSCCLWYRWCFLIHMQIRVGGRLMSIEELLSGGSSFFISSL